MRFSLVFENLCDMLLFIIIIIALSTIAFMSKNENLAYVIVFVGIVFLKTFVDIHSMPDLPNYYTGYKELASVDWFQVPFKRLWTLKCPEIGFRYVLRIGALLGSFKWSLFIVGCINAYAYLSLTKKYSPYPIISIILIFLGITQAFFVIRQHCAIGLTLLSLPFIINRDLKMFLLCIAGAFLCHQTALVFLPVYFVYGIKDKQRLVVTLASGAVFMIVAINIIFLFFVKNMVGYEGYKNSNESNATTLLISLCYYVSYIWFLKREVLEEGIIKLLFVILTLNLSVMFAGFQLTAINRLMMYYSTCIFLSVPITAYFINDKILRACFLAAVIGILAVLFVTGSNGQYIEKFRLDFALL